MSGSTKKEGKGARKPPRVDTFYAAFHETNVAMCLAGGFLGPRYEANVAYDHHAKAGELVMTSTAPDAVALAAARGSLDYGVLVVAEIVLPKAATGNTASLAIPLDSVNRLIFPTQSAAKAFEARASGFGDVPSNIVPIVVDAKFFASLDQAEATLRTEPEDVKSHRAPESIHAYDQCAGVLAAAFAAAEASADVTVFEALSALGEELAISAGSEDALVELARRLDSRKGLESYGQLLRNVSLAISEETNTKSFSAANLLRSLSASLVGVESPAITRFLEFADDVVALRRDIPDSAFADNDGAIIPRAILLFLMNPDPDRLLAIRARTPNLGERVFCLAAALIGLRSGFTALPTTLKAPSPEAFLAVPALTAELIAGRRQALLFKRTWGRKGESESELLWHGRRLARCKLPADPRFSSLPDTLGRIGMTASFGEADGVLRFDSDGRQFAFETLPSASFPRESMMVMAGNATSSLPKKKLEAAVSQGNMASMTTGIFFGIQEGGRVRKLVARAFLLQPTEAAIKEALAGIHSALDEIAKASVPAPADLFD